MTTAGSGKPIFRDLSADDPEPEVTQIESLCMNCHANGITRLLLTRIPHFKEVVLASFSCDSCGYSNNEIQSAGTIAAKGVKWILGVQNSIDLNRQVVKSDFTKVLIPEIDLEVPAKSQKGEITTVEGVIERALTGLEATALLPGASEQLAAYLPKLRALLQPELNGKFTLILEDISGNSFIQNPEAPKDDPRCEKVEFTRTKDQDHLLGIFTQDEVTNQPVENSTLLKPTNPEDNTYEDMLHNEVVDFDTSCPSCNSKAETRCKLTNIPYFKEVLIMATVCDHCGHRTNEVKSGGGIEPKGVKFEVRIAGREDFSRDILKSETCTMIIPELELEVGGRALGGRFTTAEGILRATHEQIACSPELGDSSQPSVKIRMKGFLEKLASVIEGKTAVTLVLDDPAGNSYVQSLAEDPNEPDEGLKITRYERTFEQNEELGINDMNVDNYQDNC